MKKKKIMLTGVVVIFSVALVGCGSAAARNNEKESEVFSVSGEKKDSVTDTNKESKKDTEQILKETLDEIAKADAAKSDQREASRDALKSTQEAAPNDSSKSTQEAAKQENNGESKGNGKPSSSEKPNEITKPVKPDEETKPNTEEKPAHEHKYELAETVSATCTEDGYKEYACATCGDTKTETIAKVDHKYELAETVLATCTEAGYKKFKCTMCSDVKIETLGASLGHDFDKTVEVERVPSTCSVKGHVSYKCKNCDEICEEELALDPEDHDMKLVNSDPQYNYYKCSGCGNTSQEFNDKEYTIELEDGQTITVVGHFDLKLAEDILPLLNERRAVMGQRPLTLAPVDSPLGQAAMLRAYEISYKFSHIRPNGERAITSLYPFAKTCGENLAAGQRSAEEVMQDWISSPTHDANLTHKEWNRVGMAVFCKKVRENRYIHYYCQLFSY